jgi:hypothetical protein
MAYREAQERHQEILRIEQNIAELAQLMNDVCLRLLSGILHLTSLPRLDERPRATS